MTAPLSRRDADAVVQAALLGLARRELPALEGVGPLPADGGEAALVRVALVAQRLKRERPPPPPAVELDRALPADPRPVLSDTARAAIRTLLAATARNARSPLLPAALEAVAAAGLRPHPFDLARLQAVLRDAPGALGPTERAWLLAVDGRPAAPDALDPDTWTHGTPAVRTVWLRDARARDTAGARALLEAALPGEPAATRATLLTALEVGLSADDLPLLERLAEDRAGTVREAATALLARTPGTAAHAARLQAAAARVKVNWYGKLVFEDDTATVRADTFGDARLTELAALLKRTPEQLLRAVSKGDRTVALNLVAPAARDGRLDLVEAVLDKIPGTKLTFLLVQGMIPRGALSAVDRLALVRTLGPAPAADRPDLGEWLALRAFLGGPLPAELARAELAASDALKARLVDPDARDADPELEALAACVPVAAADALKSFLASLPLSAGAATRAFAGLLSALPPTPEVSR